MQLLFLRPKDPIGFDTWETCSLHCCISALFCSFTRSNKRFELNGRRVLLNVCDDATLIIENDPDVVKGDYERVKIWIRG